jgi:hypothetical protein
MEKLHLRRFIGDRSIQEKDFGRIQIDRVLEMQKWANDIQTVEDEGMVTTKKSQDANSPYSQLTEKMVSYLEHTFETGPPPDVVANAVLKAVTSENPSMRYLAGDVEKRMEAKRSMSDEEFHEMMKQNMMK